MIIEILNRFNDNVIFTHDAYNNSLHKTITTALAAKINLRDADLSDANLRYANLSDANLRGANLSRADLSRADLSDADLSDANLSDANLRYANLRYANLRYANLSGANLSGEILTKTPLTITNLRWWVLISEQYMRIGCQRHTHAEWANFTHDEINAMDENAASFWGEWKAPLLAMCNAHSGKNSIKEVTNNG